jgi:hypothetical protein
MANTTYLKNEVEPYLRKWAARRIGVALEKCPVVVGQDSDGRDVRFEFDGVSPDGTVGVCISASTSYKTGQMRKFFMEATLLNRVSAFKRRIMVFTSRHMWEAFKNECDGLIDMKNIEPMFYTDLPKEMQVRIAEIYQQSAKEVGDKSGPGRKSRGKRK